MCTVILGQIGEANLLFGVSPLRAGERGLYVLGRAFYQPEFEQCEALQQQDSYVAARLLSRPSLLVGLLFSGVNFQTPRFGWKK